MNNCPACGSTRYNCGFCQKCKFLNNPNHLSNLNKAKMQSYKPKANQIIVSGATKKYEHEKFEPEPGMTYEKPNLNNKEVKQMCEEDQTTEETEKTEEAETTETSEDSTEEAVPDPVEDGADEAEEEVAEEEAADTDEDSEDSE